jgi:hypothetical protein
MPLIFALLIAGVMYLMISIDHKVRYNLLFALLFLYIPTGVIPIIIYINYFIYDRHTIIEQSYDPNIVILRKKEKFVKIEKDKIRLIVERGNYSTEGWFYCRYWIIYYERKKYIISSLPIKDRNFYLLFCNNSFKRIKKFFPIIAQPLTTG